MLTLATATADRPLTLFLFFLAQVLSWAGVPALGTAAIGAAGALAGQGELRLASVLVIGAIGAEIGSVIGWWIGKRYGRRGAAGHGRFTEGWRRAVDAGSRAAERWGPLLVVFVPSWVSGALGVPIRRFALWNLIAVVGYTLGGGLTAYGVGFAFAGGATPEVVAAIVIGLAALAAVGFVVLRRRRRFNKAKPAAA